MRVGVGVGGEAASVMAAGVQVNKTTRARLRACMAKTCATGMSAKSDAITDWNTPFARHTVVYTAR